MEAALVIIYTGIMTAPIYEHLFGDFLSSRDALRVYEGDTLLFSSVKDGLLPLLEYSDLFHPRPVTVFDRIMGNAAALLAVRVGCREVFSPLGSQLAIETLDRYGVKHRLSRVVPFIQRADGAGMCPMEKLSMGKDPEEFYQALRKSFKTS